MVGGVLGKRIGGLYQKDSEVFRGQMISRQSKGALHNAGGWE